MAALFRAALENNLLTENPAANLRMPDCNEDGSHRQITGNERALLLAACELIPYPAGLWAKLMLYCGLRPAETLRVYGKHIDVADCRLYIDGIKTKAAKRWVPIPAIFLEELAPYAKMKFEPILKNKHGHTLSATNMRRMWEQLRKEMHILAGGRTDYGDLRRVVPPYAVAADFVPYCLRHTYCTDLQDAGVPINVAKDFMGHSSIEMTAKIYTHLTDASFDAARRLINAAGTFRE
jgi:integrase